MSVVDTGFGQLISGGIRGGYDMALRGRDMAMAEQQHGLRMQMEQLDLLERKRRATRALESEEADAQIMGALMTPQAAPTMAGYQPTAQGGPVVRGPAGPRVPGVNLATDGSGVDGSGVSNLVGKVNTANQQKATWWGGIDPGVLAKASPRAQEMVARAAMSRQALTESITKANADYAFMKSSGMSKMMPAGMVDEWMSLGVQMDPNDLPPEIRERAIDRMESRRQGMIDWMTIADEEDAAIMGVPVGTVDTAARERYQQMDAAGVEVFYQNERERRGAMREVAKQEQAAKRANEKWAWQESVRRFDDSARAAVTTTDAALKQSTADWKAADTKAKAAEKAYRLASGQTQVLGSGATKQVAATAIRPPTPDEIKKAAHKPEDDSFWKNDPEASEIEKAQAVVASWNEYQEAKAAADEARAQADKAARLNQAALREVENIPRQIQQGLIGPQQAAPGSMGPQAPLPHTPSWEDAGTQNPGGAADAQPERLSITGSPAPEISDDHLMQAINELGADASDATIAARAAQIAGGSR